MCALHRPKVPLVFPSTGKQERESFRQFLTTAAKQAHTCCACSCDGQATAEGSSSSSGDSSSSKHSAQPHDESTVLRFTTFTSLSFTDRSIRYTHAGVSRERLLVRGPQKGQGTRHRAGQGLKTVTVMDSDAASIVQSTQLMSLERQRDTLIQQGVKPLSFDVALVYLCNKLSQQEAECRKKLQAIARAFPLCHRLLSHCIQVK